MRIFFAFGTCLAVVITSSAGCGGKVLVDASSSGVGGAATTATSGSGAGASTSGVGAGTTGPSASAGSGAGGCPTLPPDEGTSCDTPGLACPMPLLCCSPTATCSGGTWHIMGPGCGMPCIACGPSQGCSTAAVCVIDGSVGPPPPGGQHEHCAPNPCGGQALSCACAGDLCGGSGCMSVMGDTVICAVLP